MTSTIARDFKGLWIPREIWLRPKLSVLKKCLWAEVYSLHDRKKGGCYASDEYLMEFLGIKRTRLYELLNSLKKLGLLETRSNGREAIRKAIVPEIVYEEQEDGGQQKYGKADFSSTEKRTSSTPQPYIEQRDADKRNNSNRNAVDKSPATNNKNYQIIGKYKNVKLTQAQITSLKEKLKEDYQKGIDKFSEYLHESGKLYSSHYRAILNWIPNWLHNQKQNVINNQSLIEKNQRILREIISYLEQNPKRGDLIITPSGAYDKVWNKECPFTDKFFASKVAKWYGLDWKEENENAD
jgi:hypothetical protein